MKPGTKVICVDDSIKSEQIEWQIKYCPNWVKKNMQYTIRNFTDNNDIVNGILLEEIKNMKTMNLKQGTIVVDDSEIKINNFYVA